MIVRCNQVEKIAYRNHSNSANRPEVPKECPMCASRLPQGFLYVQKQEIELTFYSGNVGAYTYVSSTSHLRAIYEGINFSLIMCRLLSSVLLPEILEYSRWRTGVFSLKYWSTLAGVLTLSIDYAESTLARE